MTVFGIQASALIESTPVERLPALCAMALDAWCAENGTSQKSIAAFVGAMTQVDGDQNTRIVLAHMLSTYEAGAFFSG